MFKGDKMFYLFIKRLGDKNNNEDLIVDNITFLHSKDLENAKIEAEKRFNELYPYSKDRNKLCKFEIWELSRIIEKCLPVKEWEEIEK